jgi:hypothetical protein
MFSWVQSGVKGVKRGVQGTLQLLAAPFRTPRPAENELSATVASDMEVEQTVTAADVPATDGLRAACRVQAAAGGGLRTAGSVLGEVRNTTPCHRSHLSCRGWLSLPVLCPEGVLYIKPVIPY